VDVVDGGDGGEPLPRRARQRAERQAVELVVGVGVERLEAADAHAGERDRRVVGDGRQLPAGRRHHSTACGGVRVTTPPGGGKALC
jgi:hypothetical protein